MASGFSRTANFRAVLSRVLRAAAIRASPARRPHGRNRDGQCVREGVLPSRRTGTSSGIGPNRVAFFRKRGRGSGLISKKLCGLTVKGRCEMRTNLLVLLSLVAFGACTSVRGPTSARLSPTPSQIQSNANDSARLIMQRYADAWRGRQELTLDRNLVIAFWIKGEGGGEYYVVLSQTPGATVGDGVPTQYDLGFELDISFLRRLDRGEMNALTAMGQARSSDPTPVVPKFGPQFASIPDSALFFRRLCFHFWTRDWPETVRFGDGTTREVHGGNATVFYYDNQLRSAWYQLKAGMHINADPGGQINDYPQTVIVTRGRFRARLDGRDRLVSEGEMILIPAGMASEFWTEGDQYGEFVWLGFGPGA